MCWRVEIQANLICQNLEHIQSQEQSKGLVASENNMKALVHQQTCAHCQIDQI
jgi:hypothetical protein